MANYSISANQLTEGTSVFIRGKLAFARLTSLIEGAALAASDQRKVQNGMSPVGKPHTTATITEAEVQFADPANPTVEEQFVSERRYTSKKNPASGANYSIDSKGTNLPIIAIPSEKGDGTYDQDTSGQELAQGLDVTLVLRVYKPKNFANRGLSLDQVIVHETPRYYNAGGVASGELAARGIVFNAPPRAVQAQPGAGSAVGNGDEPVGTEVEDGLSFPAPQPAVAAPVAAPVPAQAHAQIPSEPIAAVAPAAAPVPAPVAAEQPQQETPEQKLARLERENAELKNAGSAVGAPAGQGPWGGSGDAQQAGITYQG
ncbi:MULTISPECIES: hypothetical protein [Paenarthrobacter]|uniref:Single-stranded DNA-binding protein n=1 Tax=Paenarthrobacter ureafaciens TaxID=37931 RepID=A0AAX3EEF3_PAEUR|nr:MULTISPECIES: hypothetical protein [Paenarthrobacter]NKR13315.1 hypothetical protein [Arthrobacter sp. M5]NKR14835.1 hypothetical protein [Arthrobacter sp. M6]OEH62388.1 hypothetical protein A5N13_01650 [Arthrobacter sp. D4]OEH62959.1 hypothetical protein A5N17_09890 [Arthrobacter sp. D2]MDO5865134.1 hypothetical protein [Paenarthrobacter sp. SD-2]